jgi:uncharacterized membrane protein YeaQ/YmgE (transglycosylase-associated protein family)
MRLIGYLISLVVTGLIVGALGRLAVPGRNPLSIPATIGIGIVGAFIGGLIAAALHGRRPPRYGSIDPPTGTIRIPVAHRDPEAVSSGDSGSHLAMAVTGKPRSSYLHNLLDS